MTQTETTAKPLKESFSELLDQSFQEMTSIEGSVVSGTVISIEKDMILIDVGLKCEGRVPLREFGNNEEATKINVGDTVEVYIERLEDINGQAILSREKARREEAWVNLEVALEKQQRVNGVIFGKVKGGFTVDLEGATAFLPGSQVDIRPIKDLGVLMGTPQPFQILKMDRRRGNIVVSRRAVLEDSRAEARTELVANLQEGQVLQGVIKNITDYGAFVDLGGVDGLLHVTDISWKRINHPSEALQVGESVQVKVIKFNDETQRISLGIKQLTEDPWLKVFERFPVGAKMSGVVTNITDYGSFVELEDGIEGLVHVSEMSWTKKNVHPGKIVSTSEKVEVMVLEIDVEKRRISLGIKQCVENPWELYKKTNKIGDIIKGEIRNITEFGLFLALTEDIDGLVHLSDISWDGNGDELIKNYTKGSSTQAKILDIDVEKERISLGIKQLTEDVTATEIDNIRKGSTVTCTIAEITENGLEVNVGDNLKGFIKKNDLSREKADQKTDRYGVGDKVDATVTNIDKKTRKISLSIKAREIEEEKKAMAEYGSSDSGASLGDILGAALAKKDEKSS